MILTEKRAYFFFFFAGFFLAAFLAMLCVSFFGFGARPHSNLSSLMRARASVKVTPATRRRNINERGKKIRGPAAAQDSSSPSGAARAGWPIARRIDARLSRTSSPIDAQRRNSVRW